MKPQVNNKCAAEQKLLLDNTNIENNNLILPYI